MVRIKQMTDLFFDALEGVIAIHLRISTKTCEEMDLRLVWNDKTNCFEKEGDFIENLPVIMTSIHQNKSFQDKTSKLTELVIQHSVSLDTPVLKEARIRHFDYRNEKFFGEFRLDNGRKGMIEFKKMNSGFEMLNITGFFNCQYMGYKKDIMEQFVSRDDILAEVKKYYNPTLDIGPSLVNLSKIEFKSYEEMMEDLFVM